MPVAVTTGSTLVRETNEILQRGLLLSRDDFKIKQLLRDAQKLVTVNPGEAYSTMAMIHALIGDDDEATRLIDNAIRLDASPVYLLNKCANLGNLGRFSEAQAVFRDLRVPIGDAWSAHLIMGWNSGAFHSLHALSLQAEKMQLDTQVIDRELLDRAVDALNDAGLTEDDVGAYLDVAGEVMHEARLVFLGSIEVQVIPSYEAVVSLTLLLAVDAFKAEQLDSELARRTAERIEHLSTAITVGFQSGLPENERYPAGALEALATAV